jgi:hypothetical protein
MTPTETSREQTDREFSGPQAVTTRTDEQTYDKAQRRENKLAPAILPFVLLGIFVAILVWVLARV